MRHSSLQALQLGSDGQLMTGRQRSTESRAIRETVESLRLAALNC